MLPACVWQPWKIIYCLKRKNTTSRGWKAWSAILSLLAWSLPAWSDGFLEAAERALSYDFGKFVIKPQVGLTTRFTDNVFYGNDSFTTTIYTNRVAPYDAVIPGVTTNSYGGGVFLSTSPGSVTIGTNLVFDPVNQILFFAYTNRVPAHVETINGISTEVPQRDVVSPTPGASTIGTNNFRLRPVESEELFIVSPGFRLQYGSLGLNTLTLDYNYDHISYVNNPEYNTAQHRAEFAAKLNLGRFSITGTDSLQLLSSFLNGNNSGGSSNQVDRMVWNNTYRLLYDATAKTDIYLNAFHYRYDYDQGVAIYDSETVKGTVGASYAWTERLRVFAEVEYGQSFVTPNLASQPLAPSSTIYGGFIGVRGNFTPRIQGSLQVGYQSRVFPGTFAPGEEPASVASPAVTADISYALSAKTLLKLSYGRSTDVSPQFAKQSYIYDRIQLGASQFIGSSGKWMVTATAGVNSGSFGDTPGTNFARSDSILEGGLRLTYQPRPWLAAVLAYEYENYSSKFKDPRVARFTSLVDYQVNNITFSLKIGY